MNSPFYFLSKISSLKLIKFNSFHSDLMHQMRSSIAGLQQLKSPATCNLFGGLLSSTLLVCHEPLENRFVVTDLKYPFGNKTTRFWMGFETKLSK